LDGAVLDSVEPVELLATRAYEKLRDAILAYRLLPGDRLSVPDLARQMRISRSPVREAVQRLIHEGLAEHVTHRGAEVARVEPIDLLQLYVVREVLEGLAARLAAQHVDPETSAALQLILERHEQAVLRDDDDKTHTELDIEFHRRIRELGGNPHLSEMLGRVQGRAHLALHSLWRGKEASRLAVREHRRILAAIVAADPDAAEQAARAHVVALRTRLSQTVKGSDSSRRDGGGPTVGSPRWILGETVGDDSSLSDGTPLPARRRQGNRSPTSSPGVMATTDHTIVVTGTGSAAGPGCGLA